jgi:DNA-binding transcriptional regulator YhcF (GntR family)
MNPLSQALEAIAANGAITTEAELQVIREAASEIAIASNTVQAATFLALTAAEKFADVQRRNDELLRRISDEVEAHRVTKETLAQAIETADRGVTKAEELHAKLQAQNKETTHE